MGVVMLLKVLVVVSWATVLTVSAAQAQSLSGPRENPPAGYKNAQYVDSRGCVYLRAGIGGRVSWVPRISTNRKALCDFPPTFGATQVTAAEPIAPGAVPNPPHAPSVAARSSSRVAMPMETVASLPRASTVAARPAPAPPPVVAAPAPQAAPRSTAPGVSQQSNCPSTSPYGARVILTGGNRALICSANANFDVRAALARMEVARQSQQPPYPGCRRCAQQSSQSA